MSGKTLHRFGVVLSLGLFVLLGACAGDDASVSGGGVSSTPPVAAARASLSFEPTRVFRFTWDDVSDATYYRLLEDSDGLSGYTQISGDITTGTQVYEHRLNILLSYRVNARYILESCNAKGCNSDNAIFVSGTLADAIGYIKASDTGSYDRFGNSVSLSNDGNTLAIGAYSKDSSSPSAAGTGAAYVFTRSSDGIWSQQAYLKASNSDEGDFFGISVSLSGDGNTLAVGANLEDSSTVGINSDSNESSINSGAVYIFTRSSGTWSEKAYIKANNPGNSYEFGGAVSLGDDGNTLAVGAKGESSSTLGIGSTPNVSASGSGAVYVFKNNGTSWSQQAYIKASNTGANDRFGTSVSLSGDSNTLAVGAPFEDSSYDESSGVPVLDESSNDNANSGAIYIFQYDAGSAIWSSLPVAPYFFNQSYLKPYLAQQGQNLGASVSLNGDGLILAAGVPFYDGLAQDSGAVLVFSPNSAGFAFSASTLVSPSPSIISPGDEFGSSVSLSRDGKRLVAGAVREDGVFSGINSSISDGADLSGAAYYMSVVNGVWMQQAYIKSSNSGTNDNFGAALSISGDGNTLAVGAAEEDSGSVGVNSTPNDEDAVASSGAVYLY